MNTTMARTTKNAEIHTLVNKQIPPYYFFSHRGIVFLFQPRRKELGMALP